MPANLKRRHDTWYAVLNVPRAHRAVVGRSELLATLRTSNLREASSRKHDALRTLQARVEAIVSGSPERLAVAEAMSFRASLRAPNVYDDNVYEEGDAEQALDYVREQADTHGSPLRNRILSAATGNAVFLKDLLPTFIGEQDHVNKKTAHEYNTSCEDFLEWQGVGVTEKEVTRKRAGEYIGHLKAKGLARATVQRKVSALSAFWEWMMQRGHIENNPLLNVWRGHKLGKKSKRAEEDPRRPWNDAELTVILTADWGTETKLGPAIRDLIRLALLSGVRLDEICEWKADMVERDDVGLWINNRVGKSRAARRRFPLHPIAVPIIERLLAHPDAEGYLLHDLPRGGYDKRRSFYVSKHFGRVIRKLGVTDPKVVFHTLRNTFASYMEKAHAPPNAVKLLVAHERNDMTYGTYSKGDLIELQEVIALLRYSDPIMALLAS